MTAVGAAIGVLCGTMIALPAAAETERELPYPAYAEVLGGNVDAGIQTGLFQAGNLASVRGEDAASTSRLFDGGMVREAYPTVPSEHTPAGWYALTGSDNILRFDGQGKLSRFAASDGSGGYAASAGFVDESGEILTPAAGDRGAMARMDRLFPNAEVAGLTDEVMSRFEVQLGAFASTADTRSGEYRSDYLLDSAGLEVTSPLVAEVPGGLRERRDALVDAIAGVTRPDGIVQAAVGRAIDRGLERVFAAPVSDDEGIVTIDFVAGKVTVDYAVLAGGTLNELPAGTSLLTDEQRSRVTAALSEAGASLGDELITRTADELARLLGPRAADLVDRAAGVLDRILSGAVDRSLEVFIPVFDEALEELFDVTVNVQRELDDGTRIVTAVCLELHPSGAEPSCDIGFAESTIRGAAVLP